MRKITFSGWPENETGNIRFNKDRLPATRQARFRERPFDGVNAMAGGEHLIFVSKGRLYVDGQACSVPLIDGSKKLLPLGQQLLILPDKVVFDICDHTYSYAEVLWQGECRFSLCDSQGRVYKLNYHGNQLPAGPVCGEYWVDTTVEPAVLRQFNPNGNWTVVADTCIRMEADGLGRSFAQGDCVLLHSVYASGQRTIRKQGVNYIVVDGIMGQSATDAVNIQRSMPQLDHIFVCGDRLWGCRWGEGRNTIYCSRPGDCRNWLVSELSPDSPWQAEAGTDGAFTGGVAFGKTPVFFKENWLCRVTGTDPRNFRLENIRCEGVRADSPLSPAVTDDSLYYVSYRGVMEYTGSGMPRCILPGTFSCACGGGGICGLYYLACDVEELPCILVYDTQNKLWSREDTRGISDFVCWKGKLIGLEKEFCMDMFADDPRAEGDIWWVVESDACYLGQAQLLQRVEARLSGSGSFTLEISCDDEPWRVIAETELTAKAGMLVAEAQCRPCRHFRLRLAGKGTMTAHHLAAYTM